MKFLLTWQLHQDKLHDTLDQFANMTPEQDQAMMGDGVKLLGRWHDLVQGAGAALFEAESSEAVSAYALNWNRYMDLDIAVVLDDAEARAVGQAMNADG